MHIIARFIIPTYDNAGRVYTISQPHYLNQSYYSTTNHYDPLRGYLNRQDNPDGTYKTIFQSGLMEVITDERTHSRRIIKDSLGRVKEIVEPTNGVTEYGYDIFNNLIYVKDPVGNKTFIYYNDLGQKSSMDDPYMGHWEYKCDLPKYHHIFYRNIGRTIWGCFLSFAKLKWSFGEEKG